jgi:hypothetical protein
MMTALTMTRSNSRTSAPSTATIGRIVTALPVAFLLFDSAIKFTHVDAVAQSFTQLGYPVAFAPAIGVLELACLAIYLIPSTAVLGVALLTGYLGGAIASHVRVGNPLFSHVLFPVYIAAMLWGGLYLREARLRALIPFRKQAAD